MNLNPIGPIGIFHHFRIGFLQKQPPNLLLAALRKIALKPIS